MYLSGSADFVCREDLGGGDVKHMLQQHRGKGQRDFHVEGGLWLLPMSLQRGQARDCQDNGGSSGL